MIPREIHIWRDENGRVTRVEYHEGPQHMELRVSRVVQINDASEGVPFVELTVIAKPIYHDDEVGR